VAEPERIFIVISPGPLLHAAYRKSEVADMHSRCVLGAAVVPCEILDGLPPEIREDIRTEWEGNEDDDTPVTEVPLREIDEK
jgi:hypothetical protein